MCFRDKRADFKCFGMYENVSDKKLAVSTIAKSIAIKDFTSLAYPNGLQRQNLIAEINQQKAELSEAVKAYECARSEYFKFRNEHRNELVFTASNYDYENCFPCSNDVINEASFDYALTAYQVLSA